MAMQTLDFRSKMKRARWSIGSRNSTRFITLHYNGPAVRGAGNMSAEIAQLQFDSAWHMRPGALGSSRGGDGIQYHGATLFNGTNVQLRDWSALLWHCGNAIGNAQSIAWHVPIGGFQEPTPLQLHSIFNEVIPTLQGWFNIASENVKGHREWSKTLCPGNFLMSYLFDWRDSQTSQTAPFWYKTLYNAFVRETPEVLLDHSNVALNGNALIPVGTVFAVDAIVSGVEYNGSRKYVHRKDGLGFMHESVVQRI